MKRLNPYDTLSLISALIYPHSVSDITQEAILDMFRPDSSSVFPRVEGIASQVVREAEIVEAALPDKRPNPTSKS